MGQKLVPRDPVLLPSSPANRPQTVLIRVERDPGLGLFLWTVNTGCFRVETDSRIIALMERTRAVQGFQVSIHATRLDRRAGDIDAAWIGRDQKLWQVDQLGRRTILNGMQ